MRTLDITFINCEVSLPLTWYKNCVLTDVITQAATPNPDPAVTTINAPTNAIFKIKDAKLYVPVVTLSTENYNKISEQLKSAFKRTVKWNKYGSEITKQTKTNNLNYYINPIFNKVNRLFVLSFENEEDITSFSKYYTPKYKIKDFNVLIDGNSFFDVPAKKKRKKYQKINEMSKNNDYTSGNLLDYDNFLNHCELIVTDLRKQIELEKPDLKRQINFIGKPEDDEATMLFIYEKSKETAFEFFQNSENIIQNGNTKDINLLND